jgi:hypothetical protein
MPSAIVCVTAFWRTASYFADPIAVTVTLNPVSLGLDDAVSTPM